MKFAFALHQIVMQKKTIEPGTVLPMDDEDSFGELRDMGALREASASEMSLYRMSNPDEAAAEAAAAEAAAAEAAAAEAAAAEAAATEAAAAKSKKKSSTSLVD